MLMCDLNDRVMLEMTLKLLTCVARESEESSRETAGLCQIIFSTCIRKNFCFTATKFEKTALKPSFNLKQTEEEKTEVGVDDW